MITLFSLCSSSSSYLSYTWFGCLASRLRVQVSQKILDFDKNLLVGKMCPQIGFYLILHSFINYVYTVSRIKLGWNQAKPRNRFGKRKSTGTDGESRHRSENLTRRRPRARFSPVFVISVKSPKKQRQNGDSGAGLDAKPLQKSG